MQPWQLWSVFRLFSKSEERWGAVCLYSEKEERWGDAMGVGVGMCGCMCNLLVFSVLLQLTPIH